MRRAHIPHVVLLAALALASTGCVSLTMGTNNVTHDRLERGLLVFVEDSSDFLSRNWKTFEDGISNRGVSLAIERFEWTSGISRQLFVEGGLAQRTESGEAGRDLAISLRHYAVAYPGRPIYVVGHGVGAHVALNALEQLDPAYGIDRLVLLMPNVDSHRNLSTALERVRDNAIVYSGWPNVVHGGIGPLVFGTHDTARSRPMMSMRGVVVPEDADLSQYEKLHAYGWRAKMALRGNYGFQSLGPTSPLFVRKYILPFLLDGTLPEVDKDELGPVPD